MLRTTLTLLCIASVLLAAPVSGQEDSSPVEIYLAPMAGYGIFDNSLKLDDDGGLLLEGRAGITLLQYLGFEATFGKVSADRDRVPGVDFPLEHIGANAVINLLPEKRVNPFILGGWSQLNLDEPNNQDLNLNGWEYGAGVRIALWKGANSKVDLRLEARDVFAKNDTPLPKAGDTRHHYLFTGGFQLNLFGNYKDSDGDGVPDHRDRCPDSRSGAKVDRLGCEADSDGDGVANSGDRCPDTVPGAVVDANGCPTDSDEDGVVDGVDRCPSTPKRARVNAEGCPTDSDGDGVYDGIDVCAGTPPRAQVDSQGCPLDNDADGVFDGIDQCPGTPAGVVVDNTGCPVVGSPMEQELLDTGTIQIPGVLFDTGQASLKSRARFVLQEVADILIRRPDLLIEVAGHTDSQGSDEMNMKLSRARADSVLNFLLKNNLELTVSRFTVAGYGESQPIDTNETAAGREMNRRVEFRVMEKK